MASEETLGDVGKTLALISQSKHLPTWNSLASFWGAFAGGKFLFKVGSAKYPTKRREGGEPHEEKCRKIESLS